MTSQEPAPAAADVYTIKINFVLAGGEGGFDYTLLKNGTGVANAPGRRAKVKKGNNNRLEWMCPDGSFAIRFDCLFPPLPNWEYRNVKNVADGDNIVEPRGQYKYWVAVYHTDGKVYMDDPHVVVEP